MEKKRISADILCLVFIVSAAIFFGKIILDVNGAVDLDVISVDEEKKPFEYQIYSYKYTSEVTGLNEVNLIKDKSDLNNFNNQLEENEIEIKWLSEKIEDYDNDEYYEEHALVILAINYDNNLSIIRINRIYRDKNIVIEVKESAKETEATSVYTWFAVIEINDKDSDIDLSIIKK